MGENVVGDVDFRDEPLVNFWVQVRMVLFYQAPVCFFNLFFGGGIGNAEDFIGRSGAQRVAGFACLLLCGGIRLLPLLLPRLPDVVPVPVSTEGCVIAVLIALADVLLFDLLLLAPDAVFVPGVDSVALAAFNSPDSEVRFADHSGV